jgi:prophage regulatory protein
MEQVSLDGSFCVYTPLITVRLPYARGITSVPSKDDDPSGWLFCLHARSGHPTRVVIFRPIDPVDGGFVMHDETNVIDLIGVWEVERQTGLSRPTIYRKMAEGAFPRQIKLGGSSRWVQSEVTEWIRKAIAVRDTALLEDSIGDSSAAHK